MHGLEKVQMLYFKCSIVVYKKRDVRLIGTQARMTSPGYFGSGASTQQIWLDNVHCTGTELYLRDCPSNRWGVHNNCSHLEDVGVVCEGVNLCVCVRVECVCAS